MSDQKSLDALTVLESVLATQSGAASKELIKEIYTVAVRHQYDSPDELGLRDSIRTIVTTHVTEVVDEGEAKEK
jgi:hypothetical protein